MEREPRNRRLGADPDSPTVSSELIHNDPIHWVRRVGWGIAVAQLFHSARIDEGTLETIRRMEV